jgi:hypothetical protein
MTKRLFLVTMLVAALFLSGCITLKIETDIRPDGSGTKSQIIAVDIEAVEGFAQSMGVTPEPGAEEGNPMEDSFKELEQKAATVPGATVEEYKDPATGREGIKATAPFANLDELVALSSTELFGNVDAVSFQQSGNSTTMNVAVSTSNVSEEASESAGEGGEEATPSPEEKAMQQQMLQMMNIEFTYSVIVPGVVVTYNPQDSATVEGSKITWDLSQALLETEADSVDLMVQWEGGSAPPPPPAPPAGITPGAPPPQLQPPSQPIVTPGAGGAGLQPSAEKKARLPCCPAGLLPLGLVGTGALLFRRKGSC